MIHLYRCTPMSAAITERQCAINRESHVSCLRCAGLGELVESIDGESSAVVVPVVATAAVAPKKAKTGWGYTGGGTRRASLEEAATQDRILGGGLPLEVLDAAALRTISFDVVDIDDLALIGRVEKIAYENGSTLGDEILLWLRVMEAEL